MTGEDLSRVVVGDVLAHQRRQPRSQFSNGEKQNRKPSDQTRESRAMRDHVARDHLETRRMKRATRLRNNHASIKKELRERDRDGCGGADMINLADSCDEIEPKRVAGRFDVHRIYTDEGLAVEIIELISDAEGCADNEQDGSEPEIVDLSNASDDECRRVSNCGVPARWSFSPRIIDLTRPGSDLLCEYESIYSNLAESSSSDDYESSDTSDEAEEDSDVDDEMGDCKRTSVPRMRTAVARPSLEKSDLQKKIMKEIARLESWKPWRFVYRCLEIPFETTPRTDSCGFLFERWDDFWHIHGRAVWERMYWNPLTKGCVEYNQRDNRQARATKAFRMLARDLHQKFGVRLIELVKSKPHYGWWYRPKRPVDLVRLRCQDDRLYTLHLSRFRERWPFGVRHVRLHCNSCWCLPEEAAPRSSDDASEPEEEVNSSEG